MQEYQEISWLVQDISHISVSFNVGHLFFVISNLKTFSQHVFA